MSVPAKHKSHSEKKQHSKLIQQNPPHLSIGKFNTDFFILFCILLLTAMLFSSSLSNDFVSNWDDDVYVLENSFIRDISPQGIKAIFLNAFYSGNYHPITTLSNAIEYNFFGINPKPYHTINLLLHLLNIILVFRFVQHLTMQRMTAAVTALFFAIHPMHVESVSWISERKDLLYTFFYFSSLITYLQSFNSKNKIGYYLVSLFFFLCSALSKSAAVTLPLLMLLVDYYLGRKINLKNIISKIPFFTLSLIFGLLAIYSQNHNNSIKDLTPLFAAADRIFLVSYAFVFYIVKLFVPIDLSAVYPYPVKAAGLLPLTYYLSLPLILLLAIGVYKGGKFKKELVFGILFYFITVALVLQIIPVGNAIAADRYSYVPYIGLFFIAGQFYSRMPEINFNIFKRIKIYLAVIFVLYALFFSISAYSRNKTWKNGLVLFDDVISQYDSIDFAYSNRGTERFALKDYQGAYDDYNKAIHLNPKYAKAYFNRGILKYVTNDFEGAIRDYSEAIRINPRYASAYVNRGVVKEKKKEYASAIADHTEAIRIDPAIAAAYNQRGISEYYSGKLKDACEDWKTASAMGLDIATHNLKNNCK